MAGSSVTIVVAGIFLAFVVQAADHSDRRTRYSRSSALTDTELKNKLDSIMSLLGKLNDKIDSQEQRIAVLSRQVSNVKCNGEQKQGNDTVRETHQCYIVAVFIFAKTNGSLFHLPVELLPAMSILKLKTQTDLAY